MAVAETVKRYSRHMSPRDIAQAALQIADDRQTDSWPEVRDIAFSIYLDSGVGFPFDFVEDWAWNEDERRNGLWNRWDDFFRFGLGNRRN